MNWGVFFILLYTVAAAFRDVFFGSLFQQYRFFDVVALSCAITTVTFLSIVALRQRSQFAVLRRAWREAALTNLGTACAWTSFFYSLKLLEPSVVNTIHTGIGPVTLVALTALGLHISRPASVLRIELFCQVGVFLSLIALSVVVMLELSGVGGRGTAQNIVGLLLAFGSGVFIALSSDVAKRMNDRGVSPEGVVSVRLILLTAVSATMAVFDIGGGKPLVEPRDILLIGAAGLALMTAPIYILQIGLSMTSAVSTWVLMALGPILVFAAQFLDGRIAYSPYTLGCIVLYSVFVILGVASRRYERGGVARAAA